MLRTALKPRWLGLLVFVIAVMTSFGMLGLWQLNVARDQGLAEAVKAAPQRPAAEITSVLAPHQPFPADGSGRRVTATGRYDGSGQVLVAPRRLHGARGYWIVTPLVVKATGARLAVVRGFVRDTGAAKSPGDVQSTVSGTLAPSESPSRSPGRSPGGPPGDDAAPVPPSQLGSLDLSVLANRWPGEIYNAFIFATSEEPDSTMTAGSAAMRVPPPMIGETGLSWRNAAYALQWWIFALFAAYMWWRMVRDDHKGELPLLVTNKPTHMAEENGERTNV